jgi:hypothetical protein
VLSRPGREGLRQTTLILCITRLPWSSDRSAKLRLTPLP